MPYRLPESMQRWTAKRRAALVLSIFKHEQMLPYSEVAPLWWTDGNWWIRQLVSAHDVVRS